MPSSPSSETVRRAHALLVRHLEAQQRAGRERVWLEPGVDLQAGDARARRLEALRVQAGQDPAPKSLGTLRDTFVFGTGNPRARLAFVGEAPGGDEERLGEPFVGKAGQLLDRIISAMGLERGDVYISNIVKYRPKIGEGDQGTANRKPTREEMDACLPVLRRELAILRPEIIVALGGAAYAGLTGDDETSVGRARGRFHSFEGIPFLVTYHPSYLLRNPAKSEKRKLWEDMLTVMETLGLPISEKQRGHFR